MPTYIYNAFRVCVCDLCAAYIYKELSFCVHHFSLYASLCCWHCKDGFSLYTYICVITMLCVGVWVCRTPNRVYVLNMSWVTVCVCVCLCVVCLVDSRIKRMLYDDGVDGVVTANPITPFSVFSSAKCSPVQRFKLYNTCILYVLYKYIYVLYVSFLHRFLLISSYNL